MYIKFKKWGKFTRIVKKIKYSISVRYLLQEMKLLKFKISNQMEILRNKKLTKTTSIKS